MIIVLKNADFSQSNIGTLSTWRIIRSLGAGATYEGPISIDKDAALNATVTLTEGYEIGTAGVIITMGGTVLSGAHSIEDNVITITIAEVTGNVLIKVPTVNTATGEEEEPEVPDIPEITTTSRAIPLIAVGQAFTYSSNTFSAMTKRATTYGNVKAGDILEPIQPSDEFNNEILVYEMNPKDSPEFTDGFSSHSETWKSMLRETYGPGGYTFDKDCRFLSVMLDRNNTERDLTNYFNFGLYQLRRNYTIGEATPIHAYYGTYDKNTSKFVFMTNNNVRALAVLDLKAGDVVASATDDIGFDVYKFVDKTITFDKLLVGGTTETAYKTKSWTSDADQRVMVIAKSASNPNGIVTDNLNNVFNVTFNS